MVNGKNIKYSLINSYIHYTNDQLYEVLKVLYSVQSLVIQFVMLNQIETLFLAFSQHSEALHFSKKVHTTDT